MIRILFIAPYPKLRAQVEKLCASRFMQNAFDSVADVTVVEDIPAVISGRYDAIVARGYTAQKLSAVYQQLPVIRMPISSYDIIRALKECQEKYHPKKIAVFIGAAADAGVSDVCNLMGLNVSIYEEIPNEKVRDTVQLAVREGCDALVGGHYSCMEAKLQGIATSTVLTGEETVWGCVDTAIRTVYQLRNEQIISQMHKTIIGSSKEGMMYVDAQGLIRVENKAVCQMCGKMTLLQHRLGEELSVLERAFQRVLTKGTEELGQIYVLSAQKLRVSANLTPVITNGEVNGVVINLTDITYIQNLESQIRRKLSERGLEARYQFSDIIHESTVMEETIQRAKRYAASDANVIIVGETGTGKELFAQSIHNSSDRKNGPFVVINCAALSENLLESELFGYVEGSFTGAVKGGKMGLFEQAHGGTLFLDEVEEISITTQSKLLRVLQEHQVRRIGDNKVYDIDVRIISATNESITQLVEQEKFRRDLMYRLDVLRLYVPPLRERENDAELLFRWLLEQESMKKRGSVPRLDGDALPLLKDYPFTGNIRELKNIIERVLVLGGTDCITREDLQDALHPRDLGGVQQMVMAVDEQSAELNEQEQLRQALEQCGGNRTKAAKLLGIDRSTLWRKLQKYQPL